MPKDKLYKQLEAGRSRCLFWKPSSNSICSPHDKTCQSQLYHVHHQQSLHHGHWYIQRCKWLDLPRKIQYSKYHTPPAVLPFEGNQLWWCKISLPLHKVVPPHSVRQFHWPAKIACAYRVGTNKMPTPKSVRSSIYKEKMPIFMEKKYQTSLKPPRCQWRTSAREKQRSQNSGLASKLLSGGRTSHSMHWNRRLGGSVVKDELQLEQRMQAQSGEKQHSAPP